MTTQDTRRLPAGVRSALLRADLEHAAAMAADPTIPVGRRREWAAIRDELAAYLAAPQAETLFGIAGGA